MNWKNLVLLLIAVFCSVQLFNKSGCDLWVSRPKAKQKAQEPFDLQADPAQTSENLPPPFQIEREKNIFKVTPVANYSISGLVVSTKRYYLDWQSFLAPIDVGMVWADVALAQNLKVIKYDHGNRFLHWNYRGGLPVPQLYLESHASNNHLIAATPLITRAVESLRIGERATLQGYLVNVEGVVEKQQFFWHTSTVRSDVGGGACELIYLTRLRIGDEIFE